MNSADRRERETCHFLALRVSISARKQLTEHRCGRPSSQIGVRSGPKRPDRPFPSAEAEPLQAPLEPCSRPACRTQARAAHLQIPRSRVFPKQHLRPALSTGLKKYREPRRKIGISRLSHLFPTTVPQIKEPGNIAAARFTSTYWKSR